MVQVIQSFTLVGVIFFLLSLKIRGLWPYYVPSSLFFLVIVLKINSSGDRGVAKNLLQKYPQLFDADESLVLMSSPSLILTQKRYFTLFARTDLASAVGWMTMMSPVYGVYAAIKGYWTSLALSAAIFFYAILSDVKSAFLTNDPNQNAIRLIKRYQKYCKKKEMSEEEGQRIISAYQRISEKLDRLSTNTGEVKTVK